MTQDEIIEMAKQAGCIPRRHPEYWEDVQVFATPEVLQAFAKLVAAKEIERIIAENKPEIEKCNAHIKQLEEALAKQEQGVCPKCRSFFCDHTCKQEQGESVAITHRHEWFRTGEMKAGQMRCISCGTWGQEDMPQQRTWVGLTKEQMLEILKEIDPETQRLPIGFRLFADAIEAKLKTKNFAEEKNT
jgi:hypothetical protein